VELQKTLLRHVLRGVAGRPAPAEQAFEEAAEARVELIEEPRELFVTRRQKPRYTPKNRRETGKLQKKRARRI
jgi:hypothetical protein